MGNKVVERESISSAKEFLDSLGISYRYYEHEPVETMEDCKEVAKTSGAEFCKNLFLQNRQGTEFYLLLIDQDKKFRTSEVSKLIGKSRLSFGNPEKLYEYLGVHGGAITPVGLMFDSSHKVQVLIDRSLLNMEEISVHPLVNYATLVLKTTDITRTLMEKTGHSPIFIEIN